jgi:hypothetical protein
MESQIILNVLGASKPKGLNRIAKIGKRKPVYFY